MRVVIYSFHQDIYNTYFVALTIFVYQTNNKQIDVSTILALITAIPGLPPFSSFYVYDMEINFFA